MTMVAPPAQSAGGGSQTAFTYSSEPQAVPPKRSIRAKYREDAGGGTAPVADAPPWFEENEVHASVYLGRSVEPSSVNSYTLFRAVGRDTRNTDYREVVKSA